MILFFNYSIYKEIFIYFVSNRLLIIFLSQNFPKVLMLTGDKEETAINIAVACNLVLPGTHMDQVIINQSKAPTLDAAMRILTDALTMQQANADEALMHRQASIRSIASDTVDESGKSSVMSEMTSDGTSPLTIVTIFKPLLHSATINYTSFTVLHFASQTIHQICTSLHHTSTANDLSPTIPSKMTSNGR